jgi:hypothetical protein
MLMVKKAFALSESVRNLLNGSNMIRKTKRETEASPIMEETETPSTSTKETQTEGQSALRMKPFDNKVLENITCEDMYLREIIDFLKENETFLETVLAENDKAKVDRVVEISRNMKALIEQEMRKCEFDILELFLVLKNKWSSEIKKLEKNATE